MNYTMSVEQIKVAIRDRLAHTFAVSLENATDEEYYKASALIVRELLAKGRSEFVQNAEKTGTKQIYYLCMEFLLGRSLRNNLCNLGLEENFRKALADYATTSDLETLQETISSQLSVMADQIEIRLTQTSQQIQDVGGDLQAQYDALSDAYDELSKNYNEFADMAEFYNSNACVASDNNDYYHTYACEDWDRQAFYIFNTAYAENELGLKPCPKCR